MNHDDLGNYSHTEVRNLRQQVADLQTQLATQIERADYAWRNTNVIEKAYQEERAKRDALQAELTNARNALLREGVQRDELLAALEQSNNHLIGEGIYPRQVAINEAAIAKVKP